MKRNTHPARLADRSACVRAVLLILLVSLATCTGCHRSKKHVLPLLPSATVEAPAGVQEGVFEVSYTVYDPLENPVDVVVEFATDGATFSLCTRAPGGTPVDGLATTATGLIYTFRWNSVEDSVALASQVDTVRIRVTPWQLDSGGLPFAGYSGISDEFSVDNTAPNAPPVVQITTSPAGTQAGNVTAWYSITDAEVDQGYIEALYKTSAMADWEPATLVSGSGGTVEDNMVVNMTFPIPPANRNIVWDSLADLGQTYAHEVRLRVIGHDARASAPADTDIFTVDNTPFPVAPLVTLTTPASPSRGLVTLEYEISDNNAEAANLLFELSLDGGATWQIPALVYSDIGRRVGNAILDIPCLPSPETHHVVWDSATDMGFQVNYVVRFRAKPDSGVQGAWVETADFAVDNSPPAGAPGAIITADKYCAQSGEDIQFSAMSSTGSPTTFLWSFGDGSYSPATEPLHAYNTGAGEFTVSLTVTNAAGLNDTAIRRIEVMEQVADYRSELVPYRNYSETRALLDQLAEAHPDLMTIYTIGYSVEGREIHVIKISDNVTVDEDEPTVLFDAQHHAREVMTPEVIVDIIEQLVSGYASSSEVQGWVDDYEIYLIPCVNPDSSVAVFTTDWGIRKNARGVDPNRNYPADWGNPDGSSDRPWVTTYRGPFAASEPEVQTVIAHALRTRPAAGITFHSYSNIVLYPYGSPGLSQTSQESYIQQFSEDMAANMTRDIGGAYLAEHTLWYDASGTTFDWMYRDVGTFCVLVEVGDAMGGGLEGFHPDYTAYHDSQVQGVRGGVVELMRYVGRGAISGHVTDFDTGEPLEADIDIEGFDKLNSEIRRSEPAYGSYYWLWEDGSYDVTFTCVGYATQVHNVTVSGVPVVLDVQLVKNATGNHRPTASFTTSMEMFEVGTTIFLDAAGSADEDSDSLSYNWNFGDNQSSTLSAPTHTFNRTGTHRVVLKVNDGRGGEHETWKLVHVMPVLDAPHITLMPVTGTWSRDVFVDYTLKAPFACNCSISVEYTSDGLVWHPATLAGADEGSVSANTVNSISTNTEPASHYFLWDSLTDLGPVGPTVIALKVTPYIPDQVYGDPAITNLFTVDSSAANSPPSVTLSSQAPPLFYDIAFSGTISDPDAESCSLTVEYSTDSGTSWLPASIASCENGIIAGNVITGLAAFPTGTDYSFEWDSLADLGDNHVTGIWVRVTPNDSETDGPPATLTGLEVNNVGLQVTDPISSYTADTSCDVAWLWDSTAGSLEGGLVYEMDYAAGVGNVFFYDDFRLRPHASKWDISRDTHWDGGSEAVILERASGGAGGLWHTGDVSATEWYCSFRFRITGGDNARGIYFSFYSEPTTAQYPADGYTLEFDAYYNSTRDPFDAPHIALLDGSGSNLCYALNNDFCDGAWHTVEVFYRNGLLLVEMDSGNVLGYWIETPDLSHARFGFGGRQHTGYTYYLDDVFLSEHKPVWTRFVNTSDNLDTSSGIGAYSWDTSTVSSGSSYVVRIRAYNGSGYATYSYSQPFLVEHPGTPSANLLDPTGVKNYEVPLAFTLSDPTGDTCSVVLRYSPDSGSSWFDAAIKSASAGTVDANTVTGLAAGTTQLFTVVWDAWRDLGEVDNSIVQLRLTPWDTLPGPDSDTNDFEVDNTDHPGELTAFTATAVSGTTVELSWTNPAAPSLYKTVIVRRDDVFPANPTDGVVVYDSSVDTGAYFDNQDLDNAPALVRQDNAIDFAWGNGSPDGAISDDHFSVRWTAAVDAATPGPYNFHTLSEDGVRLFVDGDRIVNRWVSRAVSEYCGYKMLARGTHRLVLEYFHNVGNAEAHLLCTGPGLPRGVVPLLPGQPTGFTDFNVSSGTTYYYTGFTFTPGGTFSTGAASAQDSATPSP